MKELHLYKEVGKVRVRVRVGKDIGKTWFTVFMIRVNLLLLSSAILYEPGSLTQSLSLSTLEFEGA
jgi:hypothetical protein